MWRDGGWLWLEAVVLRQGCCCMYSRFSLCRSFACCGFCRRFVYIWSAVGVLSFRSGKIPQRRYLGTASPSLPHQVASTTSGAPSVSVPSPEITLWSKSSNAQGLGMSSPPVTKEPSRNYDHRKGNAPNHTATPEAVSEPMLGSSLPYWDALKVTEGSWSLPKNDRQDGRNSGRASTSPERYLAQNEMETVTLYHMATERRADEITVF